MSKKNSANRCWIFVILFDKYVVCCLLLNGFLAVLFHSCFFRVVVCYFVVFLISVLVEFGIV